jgi:hypothetical protein
LDLEGIKANLIIMYGVPGITVTGITGITVDEHDVKECMPDD